MERGVEKGIPSHRQAFVIHVGVRSAEVIARYVRSVRDEAQLPELGRRQLGEFLGELLGRPAFGL